VNRRTGDCSENSPCRSGVGPGACTGGRSSNERARGAEASSIDGISSSLSPSPISISCARALIDGCCVGVERLEERAQIGGGHPLPRGEEELEQDVPERGGGLWPGGGVARQRQVEDLAQRDGDVPAVSVEPIEARIAHHEQHVEVVGRGEQAPPHQHLRQHDADGEQVGAPVDLSAHHLLGRHVAVLTLERAGLGLGLALRLGRAGDAEVP
jgi:hypothetical protein